MKLRVGYSLIDLSVAFLLVFAAPSLPAQSSIPDRLSDTQFWHLTSVISEAGGYFPSNNFISNEMGFQYPIDELKRITPRGGVYLGVGPEQNFTYIVALRPKLAIIFDIRRQNAIQHLMYKALMEMSADRADFLSMLFSRPRPRGLDATTGPARLFAAYARSRRDTAAYVHNLAAIEKWLTVHHGFALSPRDIASLEYVYSAFYEAGPEITYSFRPDGALTDGESRDDAKSSNAADGQTTLDGLSMPNYADLQGATDAAGHLLAYLATEANYQWLKDFETRNLVIPVVGNFAGDKAIRMVGDYLRAHRATVTAFYTSNVEQYLFQQGDDWRWWFENVATLPLSSTSTFIRTGRGGTSAGVTGEPSMLAPMQAQLRAFADGRIRYYVDVLGSSH
jgi:hypothetical protein